MISADDHLDLQYLPADLWTARLPTSLRSRAPRVEHRDTCSVWTCEGEVWGRWAGLRRASGPKAVVNAFDRDGMDTKPSELFRRQIWASFQEDHVAMSLLPFYGEGHVLWASDYPHPDSTWPNSRRIVEKQMGLSLEVCRQLTRDSAAALYGL